MRRALLSMMRELTVKDVFFPQNIVIFCVVLLRVINEMMNWISSIKY